MPMHENYIFKDYSICLCCLGIYTGQKKRQTTKAIYINKMKKTSKTDAF